MAASEHESSLLVLLRLVALFGLLDGDLRPGQMHDKPFREQPEQIGLTSSHFFRRSRHLKHPVFVLSLAVDFLWAEDAGSSISRPDKGMLHS